MERKEQDACSLRGDCNTSCCTKGSPYVLPEEAERIEKETGLDVFVEQGNGYVIGRNSDGSERDMREDPCPFLTEQGLCYIQEQGYSKPTDCVVHPLFFKETEGGLEAYVVGCCAAANNLSGDFVNLARKLFLHLSEKHKEAMLNHQDDFLEEADMCMRNIAYGESS